MHESIHFHWFLLSSSLHAQNSPNCCQANFSTPEVLYRNNLLLPRWFCYTLQSVSWVRDVPLHMARISGSEWLLVFLEKSLKGTQQKHVELVLQSIYQWLGCCWKWSTCLLMANYGANLTSRFSQFVRLWVNYTNLWIINSWSWWLLTLWPFDDFYNFQDK